MISHDPMTLELLVRPSLPRSGLGFDIYRGFSFIPLRSLSLNSFILIYTVIKREPVKISVSMTTCFPRCRVALARSHDSSKGDVIGIGSR